MTRGAGALRAGDELRSDDATSSLVTSFAVTTAAFAGLVTTRGAAPCAW